MENVRSYKPFRYPFKRFNPVQTEVRELLKETGDTNNMVISASTSAGKTICAEFLVDQELKKGKKIIYLSPLKSLADEKFEDWSKRFSKESISIITSDYSSGKNLLEKLENSSIIIMTSEMLDVKTRNYNSEKNFWLKDIGLLIVDESHIISSSNRGAAVEVSIMRFTFLNKQSRIMFLSATMRNCADFKNWLMMLNGKKTDVIESTWRPVELTFHYHSYDPVLRDKDSTFGSLFDYYETENSKIDKAVSLILTKVDEEKFLVFVHAKATGRKLVRKLESEGVDAVFHNANLSKTARKEIEQDFKNKKGSLQVLVSTSTLSWGVNLPARNVVIVGTKRGLEEVDPLDIIQMAGRAGRYGIDDAGDVYLVMLPGLIDKWKKVFENPRALSSMLDSPKVLAFHVLAEVNNGIITDELELRKWYRRTLRYLQTLQVPTYINSSLIQSLQRIFMIRNSKPLVTTRLGEISSQLYFSPYDVSGWYFNFKTLVSGKKIDDYRLSWALFNVPKNESWIPKELKNLLTEFNEDLQRRGIGCKTGRSLLHIFVGYSCLSGDEMESGLLNSIKREIIFDFDRLSSAVRLILSTFPKSTKARRLEELTDGVALRIKYGIPVEAVALVKIKGIGAKRALNLIDLDIHNAKDILNSRNKRRMLSVFSSRVCKTMVLNSREHLRRR